MIGMIKEVLLFNSFESAFLITFFLIEMHKKINIFQFCFHVLMLSVLNWTLSVVIPIPIVYQLAWLIITSFYLFFIFNASVKNNLFVLAKALGLMFIIETLIVVLYQFIFKIDLTTMQNDFDKFIYFLVIRFVELIYLIIKYRRCKYELT